MTVLKALQEIKKILSDEKKWCKRAYAKTADDGYAGSTSTYAVAWCLGGAVSRVCLIKDPNLLHKVNTAIAKVIGPNIESFNDNHTYQKRQKAPSFSYGDKCRNKTKYSIHLI